MGEVIRLRRAPHWEEALSIDSHVSTLQLYVLKEGEGQAEIVQLNDDGESIRTTLSAQDVDDLIEALTATRAARRVQR